MERIIPTRYGTWGMRVVAAALRNLSRLSERRYQNGMRIINGLGDDPGIILPGPAPTTYPAFNRLPIFIKDFSRIKKIRNDLDHRGVETSPMYYKPLHYKLQRTAFSDVF